MKIYITRRIPDIGIKALTDAGHEVEINKKDRPLSKKELIKILRKGNFDAVLTLLTDTIDAEVMDNAPSVKIYANYAIGFNNFDLAEAKKHGIYMTNTPGGGAERVSEHTWALILSLTCRVVEADKFTKKGKYNGWNPMLFNGTSLSGKTLGIIGTGKIGADVAHKAVNAFAMKVVYYDIVRNEDLEKKYNAVYFDNIDEILKVSDIVSIHVPLNDSTHHLINENRLSLMKRTAIIVNTSRRPVIDENALVNALKNGQIASAGLDVFEFEPKLAKGLAKLDNVVLTPHIASATLESRHDRSEEHTSELQSHHDLVCR